jgi:hypothetical protein
MDLFAPLKYLKSLLLLVDGSSSFKLKPDASSEL